MGFQADLTGWGRVLPEPSGEMFFGGLAAPRAFYPTEL